MNIAMIIIFLLALLKFTDLLFFLKRRLLYKPNTVICVLINNQNYLTEVRQSINRFYENRHIYKKLIFVYSNLLELQIDYCIEQIKNIKNVEIISCEVFDEELCNCFWNG